MNDAELAETLPSTYWQNEVDRKNSVIRVIHALAGELYSERGEDDVTANVCRQIKAAAECEIGA